MLIFFIFGVPLVSEGDCKHAKDEHKFYHSSRIINGRGVSIYNYPYAVRIENYNYSEFEEWAPRCGGSILAPSVILTACHCLTDATDEGYSKPKHVRVNVGRSDFSKGSIETGQVVMAKKLVPHPKCRKFRDIDCRWKGTYENDVGIITLKHPLLMNARVQTIEVFSSDPKVANEELERLARAGARCETVGWGYFIDGLDQMSPLLMVSQPYLMTSKACREMKCARDPYYCDYSFCRHNQQCAIDPNSTVCSGDSGGPLVCNGFLFGVTSYGGKGCIIGADWPAVYSNINLILYFYNKYVKPDRCNCRKTCPSDDNFFKPIQH